MFVFFIDGPSGAPYNPFDNPHDIFLPGILVILCIISNLSGVVHGQFLVK
jgi:hypothetical protein